MKTTKFFLLVLTILQIGCQKDNDVNELKCDGFLDEACFAAVMGDGKTWTTRNLDIIPGGYEDQTWSYNGSAGKKLGLLYTWEAAKAACTALGLQWRLPAEEEWQALIKVYSGKNIYVQLAEGGESGFNAQLGGQRSPDGMFNSFGENGYYWSGTEKDAQTVSIYNFLPGEHAAVSTVRPSESDKDWGYSCRCIKN